MIGRQNKRQKDFKSVVSKNTIPTLFVAAILYILCTRVSAYLRYTRYTPKNCITSPSREKMEPTRRTETTLRHLPMHHLQLSKPHDMMPFCGNFEPRAQPTQVVCQEITGDFLPTRPTKKKYLQNFVAALGCFNPPIFLAYHFV